VDEGRKRVLLIAASILAARKLAQYEPGKRVPASICAVADSVRWAEQIMEEIDRALACVEVSLTPEKRGAILYTYKGTNMYNMLPYGCIL
jgi:hypothetical protein